MTDDDSRKRLKPFTIRVPSSWLKRIDARIAAMEFPPTRTSVIIDVVNRWLDEEDAREGAAKGDRRESGGNGRE
jgi:hypothetical protein